MLSRYTEIISTVNDSARISSFIKLALSETEAVNDWRLVGQALGFAEDQLDKIQDFIPYDENFFKVKLITKWVETDKLASISKLAKALIYGGNKHLGEEIYNKFGKLWKCCFSHY